MILRWPILLSVAVLLTAAPDPWEGMHFLIGDWTGEGGGGSTGQGAGAFSFQWEAGHHAMLRRNRADYPPSAGRPVIHHEDLMMIYADSGKPPEALYVDSEGHVIRYQTEVASRTVRFTSNAVAGVPRYRLTYRQTEEDSLSGQFEIAAPDKPDQYTVYLTWTAKRKR